MTPHDFDRCLDDMDEREGPSDDFAFWRGLGFGLSICGAGWIVGAALVAMWLDFSVWNWIDRRF